MAKITLQADPLIEWEDTDLTMSGQTADAQQWVTDNLYTQTPTDNTETIIRSGKADLTRITDQTYTDGTRTLVVARTHNNQDDCSVASTTYTMT